MRLLGRTRSAVFAGDSRVWRAATIVALPLLALILIYCAVPRDYYTGTDSVETTTFVAPAQAGQPVCVRGLTIPPGTRRLQFEVIAHSAERPALRLRLLWGTTEGEATLPARQVGSSRLSYAVFPVGAHEPRTTESPATACLTADGEVNWGGTALPAPPSVAAPTLDGKPLSAQISAWYLPERGSQRSYLSQASTIFSRASLFRPGFVGPWLYWLMLFAILPLTALLALRALALAAAGSQLTRPRATAASLFVLAAVNFCCWALITPVFQAPDEVDHFAYTQSLVERGEQPSQQPGSSLPRWSTSEGTLLEAIAFPTDHQIGDSRVPWEAGHQRSYDRAVAAKHPSASDGGGNETAATHGPIYYAALAPAYMLASSSPATQLTLMRLASALLGALAVLFAFLLARELAPSRPWLAVLAAGLVAFQPMYGFISGAVNNDVGVNAAAAALELLVILILKRGWRLVPGLLLGLLLLLLPAIKETGLSLYPAVGLALLGGLWRHHRRRDFVGLGAFVVAAGVGRLLVSRIKDAVRPTLAIAGVASTATAASSVAEAKAHPFGYLAYLWEVFLPRLSFMAPHFETSGPPAFLIFVERGWGAFGWYDVLFPRWVFDVIFVAMIAVVPLALLAAYRERTFLRANAIEVGFLVLCPILVVAGVEAAFYTVGVRPLVAEFGRYAFPAIVPLALLVTGAIHAFGRRRALLLGTGLLTAMMALSFAGQLLTLTRFYA